jgi:hypothetical protein
MTASFIDDLAQHVGYKQLTNTTLNWLATQSFRHVRTIHTEVNEFKT